MSDKIIFLFFLLVSAQFCSAVNTDADDTVGGNISGYYYSGGTLNTSDPTTVNQNAGATLTALNAVKIYPVFRVILGGTLTIRIDDNDSDNDGFFDDYEGNLFGNLNQSPGSDYDGDGMPNAWEVAYGLNPLVNDASGDLDGDGYSNLAEYNAGSIPTDQNSYPNKAVYTFDYDANGNLINTAKQQ